ncbi:MAG: 4-(cytidine 5'-diphospho)-2-C-methyl-D-erythritol kinase [Anaerolinea sp.]|nr:4-(cytidine 5'-diphospho)-2-C-methyl-D-erythritol kinase [Anaerolinea sp.]
MAERLTGQAPAKLNLVLEVTARRDDGYHEVDTVLQTLELADEVGVVLTGGRGVQVDGPYARGTPTGDSNLAWRAAAGLAQHLGRDTRGLGIRLTKRIPPAAGLGGGASDAATVLRLLQAPWGATEGQLLEVANSIGSDEAFFLVRGTARARGRGELVTPLPPLARHGVVLFIPPETIEQKTARMFAALDRLPVDAGGVAETFARRAAGPFRGADVYNSFERVAFDVFEGLGELWAELEDRTGEPIRLAGAGPTLFWIGAEHVTPVVAAAAEGLACTVIETATAGGG